MQVIDVRDLAAWIVKLVERRVLGILNAAAPAQPYLLGSLLQAIRDQVNPSATLIRVSPDFLKEKEVGPWMELPLYLGGDPKEDPMMRVDLSRALSEDLTYRPLSDTVRDTLEWAKLRPSDHKWRAGLSADRESALLDDWKNRCSPSAGATE
jgi:2'-hydroxyisoflavone reductase